MLNTARTTLMTMALNEVLRDPSGSLRRQVGNEMEEEGRDRGEHDVDARSGERHQHHVAARMAQGIEIDRHRLGIAEHHGRAHQQEQRRHQDGAEQVDVLQRIEGDAAQAIGGVVAQAVGDEAVRGLVQRDGDHDRQHPDGGRVQHRLPLHRLPRPLRCRSAARIATRGSHAQTHVDSDPAAACLAPMHR